jgi:hypothetical protein
MELQSAFKEWAAICKALAEGKQSIILRKGGIAEAAGAFTVAQLRFWLFPTYFHQQRSGIRPEALPLLEEAEKDKPREGTICLNYWAEVTGIYRVHDLVPALLLSHLHFWSDATIELRFNHREPGIHVLSVRVYKSPQAQEIADLPAYAGCKSWVDLSKPLPTEGSVPVLTDQDYQDVKWHLDKLLSPTALA